MSNTSKRICELVTIKEIWISEHGYDELAEDGLFISDIISGVLDGLPVEDHPT